MRIILNNIILFIFMIGILLSDPYKPLDTEFLKEKTKSNSPSTQQNTSETKNNNPKAFENIIKDFDKIEGLFTFYIKSDKRKRKRVRN